MDYGIVAHVNVVSETAQSANQIHSLVIILRGHSSSCITPCHLIASELDCARFIICHIIRNSLRGRVETQGRDHFSWRDRVLCSCYHLRKLSSIYETYVFMYKSYGYHSTRPLIIIHHPLSSTTTRVDNSRLRLKPLMVPKSRGGHIHSLVIVLHDYSSRDMPCICPLTTAWKFWRAPPAKLIVWSN